jgi:pantetheine-phosphate adenylyltransferase
VADTSGIYAGTFDPITLGHVDLMHRARKLFDRLTLAVAGSTPKTTLFTIEERVAMAREVCACDPSVEVVSFEGLLVDFARKRGIRVLVRGLRAFSDFEYEFQMALTNRKLAPEIETIFLMPNESYSYVSSSIIRQVAAFGGRTGDFVPPEVQPYLEKARRDHRL